MVFKVCVGGGGRGATSAKARETARGGALKRYFMLGEILTKKLRS